MSATEHQNALSVVSSATSTVGVMSVSASTGGLKKKAKKLEAKPLDDDDYTDGLEAIIERDFFPDLALLKARNKKLEK